MKSSTILALLFYILALLHIIDWILFSNRHKELAPINHKAFKQLYYDHFPAFIKPLLTTNSRIESFILFVLLIISGSILLKENRAIYKIVGINAFIFAAWYLFSLM